MLKCRIVLISADWEIQQDVIGIQHKFATFIGIDKIKKGAQYIWSPDITCVDSGIALLTFNLWYLFAR